MRTHPAKSPGFSLVELMIAVVAGLIVTGAALMFTISSLQANSEFVQSTRLNQELRSSMDFVTRELRRASYDDASITYVLNPAGSAPSPFAPILVQDGGNADDATDPDSTANNDVDCIIYAYDRTAGTAGAVNLARGEIRALRRRVRSVNGLSVGVIEMAESATGLTPTCDAAGPTYTAYPATCNNATGWCALSDPYQLNVTAFAVDITRTTIGSNQQIREISASIRGSLPSQTSVVRGLQTNITVRSPCLRTTITDCNATPTGT